jgi:hypothetical protein
MLPVGCFFGLLFYPEYGSIPRDRNGSNCLLDDNSVTTVRTSNPMHIPQVSVMRVSEKMFFIVRFEVLSEVNTKIMFLWQMTQYSLVEHLNGSKQANR